MDDRKHKRRQKSELRKWTGSFSARRRKIRDLVRDAFFSEQIINNSRSMISVINRNYVYEKVNRTFCMNQNRVADQIVGYSIEDIWGRDNFVRNIKNNLDNCFEGRVVYYQANFETPAWGKRYYEVIMKPVFTDQRVTHVLSETFDVTEIKLKEQAATEIEWEFRNLESNLPIGFFRCDTDFRLLGANRAFLRIFHLENETEILKMPLRYFYSDSELFDFHCGKLLEEKTISFGRINLRTLKGNEIIGRVSAFVVSDGMGNPIYIDGAVEDFTREADLEKKLLQTQKLDTIGLLAGGIAHDFNTIITTIYGHCEMSLEDLDPESETYGNIEKVIKAVGRARSLTSQILTFSRQTGQERIKVRLEEIVCESVGFAMLSVPSGIDVESNQLAPDVFVSADPTQLFRVFINLISNAFQAMEATGGKLTVSLERKRGSEIPFHFNGKKEPEEYAIISFKDTGPGMDESTSDRMFEPFFTAGKPGKGTGLGLSVVYGIITEIEGDIHVSSKPNEGTTINVIVPSVTNGKPSQNGTVSKARLLLVSDNDNEARITAMALSGSGFTITHCSAREDWKSEISDSDLVVLFDKSPDFVAADSLFSLAEAAYAVPVLLISDFNVWFTTEKELPSGMSIANLSKPVSLKEIALSIDSLLKKPE